MPQHGVALTDIQHIPRRVVLVEIPKWFNPLFFPNFVIFCRYRGACDEACLCDCSKSPHGRESSLRCGMVRKLADLVLEDSIRAWPRPTTIENRLEQSLGPIAGDRV